MEQTKIRQCPGCKVIFPYQEGLEYLLNVGIGRYGVASPECLLLLQQITLKDYECGGHASIDAYAVQHPPRTEIQQSLGISQRLIAASKQSVAIHLLGLYLMVEKKLDRVTAGNIMQRVLTLGFKLEDEELIPPVNLGSVTIVDVSSAITCQEYLKLKDEWSRSACKAWKDCYSHVQKWYEKYCELEQSYATNYMKKK